MKEQAKFAICINCVVIGFVNKELMLLAMKEDDDQQHSPIRNFLPEETMMDQYAKQITTSYTGITDPYISQSGCYRAVPDEDHECINISYSVFVDSAKVRNKKIEENRLTWVSLAEFTKSNLDSADMVNEALKLLKHKASSFNSSFHLLPKKFTLTQLQNLYEAIYGESMDKRNFRKKIFSLDILKKLDEKDKINSRKGAFFYTLSEDYKKKMASDNYTFPEWLTVSKKM